MMGNYHVRCGVGEKPEMETSEAYLSLFSLPDDFDKILSVMRSRGVSVSIILQNLAQLKALFEGGKESLYYELSKKENELAIKLAEGVQAKGYKLWLPHQTNQVFVIMPNEQIAELEKDFFFYTWCPFDETNSVIRLVAGWGSTEEDVESFLKAI